SHARARAPSGALWVALSTRRPPRRPPRAPYRPPAPPARRPRPPDGPARSAAPPARRTRPPDGPARPTARLLGGPVRPTARLLGGPGRPTDPPARRSHDRVGGLRRLGGVGGGGGRHVVAGVAPRGRAAHGFAGPVLALPALLGMPGEGDHAGVEQRALVAGGRGQPG